MKMLIIILFIFFKGYAQSLEESEVKLIKNNILSYRIYYLSKNNVLEYEFINSCLLPQINWDLKINYFIETNDMYKIFKGYEIIKIKNDNYTYFKYEDENMISINNTGCGFVDYSENIIIAKKKNHILFISGMIFKDPISNFFDLRIESPVSFYDFISIKLDNYSIENIKFKKIKKGKLIFVGLISNSKVFIEIDKFNFDKINLIFPKPKKTIYITD